MLAFWLGKSTEIGALLAVQTKGLSRPTFSFSLKTGSGWLWGLEALILPERKRACWNWLACSVGPYFLAEMALVLLAMPALLVFN